MKKLFSVILLTFFTLCITAQAEVSVTFNDEPLNFEDVQPVNQDGHVLVPMRAIFEKLGATVNWEGDTKTVFAISGSDIIILQIGNQKAFVNSETVDLDAPAIITDGRTLVPLRFISESLGAKVDWIEAEEKVVITK